MSKKHLNTSAITNELSGQSLFFARPAQPRQEAEHSPTRRQDTAKVDAANKETVSEQAHTRTGERANTRTGEQVNARTPERPITRQSYNVYDDQHRALKRLEAQAALTGKKARPISEMVREALDDFIKKQPKS